MKFHIQDKYYQLVFPVFWESFLPRLEGIWHESPDSELRGRIRSFPYTRSEVESALVDFQDAAGKIFASKPNLYFRQCCCRDRNGNRKPCSVQKDGFSCRRSGVLIRMELVSENIVVERRRKLKEEERIQDAVTTTKAICLKYLKSHEGSEMLRRMAIKRLENDQGILISPSPRPRRSKTTESDQLDEMIKKLRQEYVQNEINTKIKEVIETNRKIRKVLNAWIGITVEEVFQQWRMIVAEVSRLKVQQKIHEQQAIQIEYDELEEKKRSAELEVRFVLLHDVSQEWTITTK